MKGKHTLTQKEGNRREKEIERKKCMDENEKFGILSNRKIGEGERTLQLNRNNFQQKTKKSLVIFEINSKINEENKNFKNAVLTYNNVQEKRR